MLSIRHFYYCEGGIKASEHCDASSETGRRGVRSQLILSGLFVGLNVPYCHIHDGLMVSRFARCIDTGTLSVYEAPLHRDGHSVRPIIRAKFG